MELDHPTQSATAGSSVAMPAGSSVAMPALSVIAPCLNEQDNIDALVERTLQTFDLHDLRGELILVDDGSTDQTWSAIAECMAVDRRVRGTRHSKNRGMELAWKSGLAVSRGPLICLIDADLQNQPEDIAHLFSAYQIAGKDIIQAVRCPVAGLKRWQFFSRGLNDLLNLSFGMHSSDNKSGFILCSRDVLHKLLSHRFRYRYFQNFIGASARVHGFSIGEVNTVFDRRHHGASFLSRYPVVTSMKIFNELMKFRAETLLVPRASLRVDNPEIVSARPGATVPS